MNLSRYLMPDADGPFRKVRGYSIDETLSGVFHIYAETVAGVWPFRDYSRYLIATATDRRAAVDYVKLKALEEHPTAVVRTDRYDSRGQRTPEVYW